MKGRDEVRDQMLFNPMKVNEMWLLLEQMREGSQIWAPEKLMLTGKADKEQLLVLRMMTTKVWRCYYKALYHTLWRWSLKSHWLARWGHWWLWYGELWYRRTQANLIGVGWGEVLRKRTRFSWNFAIKRSKEMAHLGKYKKVCVQKRADCWEAVNVKVDQAH